MRIYDLVHSENHEKHPHPADKTYRRKKVLQPKLFQNQPGFKTGSSYCPLYTKIDISAPKKEF
jgi:hypothetical protein